MDNVSSYFDKKSFCKIEYKRLTTWSSTLEGEGIIMEIRRLLPNWRSEFYLYIIGLFALIAILFGRKFYTVPYIITASWMLYVLSRKDMRITIRKILFERNNYMVWGSMLAYALISIVSTAMTQGDFNAFDGPWRVYDWLFAIAVTVVCMATYDQSRLVILFRTWQALLLCIISLYIGCYKIGWLPWVYSGVFDNANKYATIMEMLCLAVCSNAFFGYQKKYETAFYGLVAVMGFAALFSRAASSTSSLLIPVLIIGVLLILSCSLRRSASLIPLCFCVALVSLLAVKPDLIMLLKKLHLSDTAWVMKLISSRNIIWDLSFDMITQSPWIGVGAGHYKPLFERSLAAAQLFVPGSSSLHSHSIWLHPFVVNGIIGGFAHFLIMIYIIKMTIAKFYIPFCRPLAMNVLMIWFVYLFYGLVECAPAFEELVLYVWGSVGLLMGIQQPAISGQPDAK